MNDLTFLALTILGGIVGAMIGSLTAKWYTARRRKNWWYPYKSPEEAYELDWMDAIVEYMKRCTEELWESGGNNWPKSMPWEDSQWMRETEKAFK